MPTSDCGKIPVVCWRMLLWQPKSVLDLGIGFGKYGVLAREYLEVWRWRYFPKTRLDVPEKSRWQTRLVGVEICEWYHNPLHDFVYDDIHWGTDVRDTKEYLNEPFDLILLLDVIEHMEKEEGQELLRRLYEHAGMGVIVSHPFPGESALAQKAYRQGAFTNEHEEHLSVWDDPDFEEYPYRLALKPRTIMLLAKNPELLVKKADGR